MREKEKFQSEKSVFIASYRRENRVIKHKRQRGHVGECAVFFSSIQGWREAAALFTRGSSSTNWCLSRASLAGCLCLTRAERCACCSALIHGKRARTPWSSAALSSVWLMGIIFLQRYKAIFAGLPLTVYWSRPGILDAERQRVSCWFWFPMFWHIVYTVYIYHRVWVYVRTCGTIATTNSAFACTASCTRQFLPSIWLTCEHSVLCVFTWRIFLNI